ncbi:hypothetical protein ABZP36_000705 [Zizania latifolia]
MLCFPLVFPTLLCSIRPSLVPILTPRAVVFHGLQLVALSSQGTLLHLKGLRLSTTMEKKTDEQAYCILGAELGTPVISISKKICKVEAVDQPRQNLGSASIMQQAARCEQGQRASACMRPANERATYLIIEY